MKIRTQKQAAIVSVITVLGIATVFFRFVEGWTWFTAFYFSVITMSTVGYGQIVPATILGKVGVIALIFFGVGTLAFLFQIIASEAINKRLARDKNNKD